MYSNPSTNENESNSFRTQTHHCPTCHCSRHPSSNIYLSSADPLALTFNPFHLFAQTSPRSFFSSSSRPNVKFAYSNPIFLRHKSEGKLSTKQYKNRKFPHFNSKDLQQPPILQIVKKKERAATMEKSPRPKETVQTPCKPKLKMNKIKSNKYLQLQSRKSSSSLNIFSKPSSLQEANQNEEQSRPQVLTPVGNLKENNTPRGVPPVAQMDYLPQVKPKKGKADKSPSKRGNLIEISNSSKYPTIKSIEVYRQCTPEQQQFVEQEGSETSLRVEEGQEGTQFKKLGLIEASDEEIGQNISDELELHYDYLWLIQESDRSLSLQVEL